MFTGIIETLGKLIELKKEEGSLYLQVESSIGHELKIDQSLAHNGICLTIVELNNTIHTVCAVPETIAKTTISDWKPNDKLNLERCMLMNGRIDGHIVQGHVDTISRCIQRVNATNSWLFTFEITSDFAHLVVEKGSITINGTSLTCFNVTKNTFEVAIIPYTFNHTSIYQIQQSDFVNIEFDIVGKYISRLGEFKKL